MRKMTTWKKICLLNLEKVMSRNIEIRVESKVEINEIYTQATEPAREQNLKTLPKSEKTRNFEYPPKDEKKLQEVRRNKMSWLCKFQV